MRDLPKEFDINTYTPTSRQYVVGERFIMRECFLQNKPELADEGWRAGLFGEGWSIVLTSSKLRYFVSRQLPQMLWLWPAEKIGYLCWKPKLDIPELVPMVVLDEKAWQVQP